MSTTTSAANYDEIPYPSGPFRQTHPCHLATLLALFGVEPVPPTACRVLELGCASGGNLIPMAQDLPGSQFVGVDLSRRQIADGMAQLDQLPFDNIQLKAASILEIDDSYGQFDYIICHGVYSWVPRDVQQKILDIGHQRLSPRGVLYVSYNTYPGWHLRAIVRDMMLYHSASFDQARLQIEQSRLLLDFLVKSATPHSEGYRQVLRDEASVLRHHSDGYLAHEHLETCNDPCYFHEFVARAENAGLQYLGDTDFSSMVITNLAAEVRELLATASFLQQEQYMDFLRGRAFRCSTLCHRELALSRHVDPQRLAKLHVGLTGPLHMEGPLDHQPADCQINGRTFQARAPITKAALRHLESRRPAMTSCHELVETAQQALQDSTGPTAAIDEPARERLLADLATLLASRYLEVAQEACPITTEIGERPQATPFARLQAQRGDTITSRRHEQIKLDVLSRGVLRQLDGRHDRSMLAAWLRARISSGEITIRRDGEVIQEIDAAQIEGLLDAALKLLASNALLVA